MLFLHLASNLTLDGAPILTAMDPSSPEIGQVQDKFSHDDIQSLISLGKADHVSSEDSSSDEDRGSPPEPSTVRPLNQAATRSPGQPQVYRKPRSRHASDSRLPCFVHKLT